MDYLLTEKELNIIRGKVLVGAFFDVMVMAGDEEKRANDMMLERDSLA